MGSKIPPWLWFFIALFCLVQSRIHKLSIKGDSRKYIALSTFGFYKGGILDVKLYNFHADNWKDDDVFGFSLDRTLNDAMNPYLDAHTEQCLLEDYAGQVSSNTAAILFIMDRKNDVLLVNSSQDLNLHIYRNQTLLPVLRPKRDSFSDHLLLSAPSVPTESHTSFGTDSIINEFKRGIFRRKRTLDTMASQPRTIPLVKNKQGYYNTNFVIFVASEKEEGLYNLYFHSCPNYGQRTVSVDFSIEIEEKNKSNYLSAGEMPLPALYFMMSILFFLSGCFWVFILVKSKHAVYKIHYLMAALVYLKSLSLLFHAINFHFIETKGEHVAAWAILYYIAHLLKGSVLFITIVLIGTGWTFIKHLLSERDKKIFMIVIPLQVLANVVKIIIEESEEGDVEHKTWLDVFMLVDLLCCGAILFPVVWSIRYLQEAAFTDGKAAIVLRKLKLFRHFYIMIVCYIYFTRIIVYLLQMTVSFQYEWLDEMFREMVTYVFFVLTGYKFRPASANPYFQLDQDEDDSVDIVVSQCGVTEGISKLSRLNNEQGEEDTENLLVSKRESSHEYD
ncbi:hypothetical protein O3M35_002109 [Rhynocoris fuscipes]|uniref:GOST seven transmembrane domain-containing protein n=1 Tax=Rhynocoris fuscipes TaxID=488301 RepID=A0AAW1CWF6_9HEMI